MEHIDSNTLWHYVTGESSNDQALYIKKHLNSCEDCMKEFELLSQIELALHVVDEETTSLGFSDIVIRKIENEAELERKSAFFVKFFPYTILGGFALAVLTAIIASVELEIDLTQLEGFLNNRVGLILLYTCGLLWGLYFIDRICKKIFIPIDFRQS